MKLKQVLEEKPKEVLLHQTLTEIERRWEARVRKAREGKEDGASPAPSSANVLLMIKDEHALRSIHSYLSVGGKRAISHSFLNYLDTVVEKVKPMLRHGGHDQDSLPVEQRLLYEEHSRVRNFLFGPTAMRQHDKAAEGDRKVLSDWKRKHRKVTEERTRGMAARGDAIRHQACLEEAVEKSKGRMSSMLQGMNSGTNSSDDGSENSWSSEEENGLSYKVEPIEGLSLFIRTFSELGEGEGLICLHDIRPDYVVRIPHHAPLYHHVFPLSQQ